MWEMKRFEREPGSLMLRVDTGASQGASAMTARRQPVACYDCSGCLWRGGGACCESAPWITRSWHGVRRGEASFSLVKQVPCTSAVGSLLLRSFSLQACKRSAARISQPLCKKKKRMMRMMITVSALLKPPHICCLVVSCCKHRSVGSRGPSDHGETHRVDRRRRGRARVTRTETCS